MGTKNNITYYQSLPIVKKFFRAFIRKQYEKGISYYQEGKLKENIICDWQRYLIAINLLGSTINWKIAIITTYLMKIKKHNYLIRPEKVSDERVMKRKRIPISKFSMMIYTEPNYNPEVRERNIKILKKVANTCKTPKELLEEKDENGLYLCRNSEKTVNGIKNGKMSYCQLWRIMSAAIERVGLNKNDGYSPMSFSYGMIYDIGIDNMY